MFGRLPSVILFLRNSFWTGKAQGYGLNFGVSQRRGTLVPLALRTHLSRTGGACGACGACAACAASGASGAWARRGSRGPLGTACAAIAGVSKALASSRDRAGAAPRESRWPAGRGHPCHWGRVTTRDPPPFPGGQGQVGKAAPALRCVALRSSVGKTASTPPDARCPHSAPQSSPSHLTGVGVRPGPRAVRGPGAGPRAVGLEHSALPSHPAHPHRRPGRGRGT